MRQPQTWNQRYDKASQAVPDCVLLMRIGDFYEAAKDSADVLADVCGIPLAVQMTGRRLAGFQSYNLSQVIDLLHRRGHTVAVLEPGDKLPTIHRIHPWLVEA